MRGVFGDIIKDNALYTRAKKLWTVSLLQSELVWLPHLRESKESFLPKGMVREHFKKIKHLLTNEYGKKFVYFVCSRVKIRFSSTKQPHYMLFSSKIKLFFTIGNNDNDAVVYLKKNMLADSAGHMPHLETDTDRITFLYKATNTSITWHINDFIEHFALHFDTTMEVHYVGCTDDPVARFTKTRHDGLVDVLSAVSGESRDFFVLFNVFSVFARTCTTDSGISFMVSNAAIDEVQAGKEADIIEKAFILYFDSTSQYRNRHAEYGALRNNLKNIAQSFNIDWIQIVYEHEEHVACYNLCSHAVQAQYCHEFFLSIQDGEVNMKRGHNVLKAALCPEDGP